MRAKFLPVLLSFLFVVLATLNAHGRALDALGIHIGDTPPSLQVIVRPANVGPLASRVLVIDQLSHIVDDARTTQKDGMGLSVFSLIQSLLLIIGGIWTFVALILRRELATRVEFSVDVQFIGVHGKFWLTEILANVDNKGLRRHKVAAFSFWVRYLTDCDSISYGDENINYQVIFPKEVEKVTYPAGTKTETKHRSWVHPKAMYTYVEPGIRQRYSYVIAIPCDAKFVLVHGEFKYERGQMSAAISKVFKSFRARKFFATQDRLVQVPEKPLTGPTSGRVPHPSVSRLWKR